MTPRNTVLAALTIIAACFPAASQRNDQLEKLFAEYNENTLRENPEIATLRGRMEYNDR